MSKETQAIHDLINSRIERIRGIVRKNRNRRKKGTGSQVGCAEHPSLQPTPEKSDDSSLIYIGGIAGMQEGLCHSTDAVGYRYFVEEAESVAIRLLEEASFYVFRTDTNAVLARGIQGFEAAKAKANQLRKLYGLKWDQVRFKAERGSAAGSANKTTKISQTSNHFGVSADGKTFTNAYGERRPVDYSRKFNPSKGRRFRGYYDKRGNYHDID